MRRDMDLVRHILSVTADSSAPLSADYFTDGYSKGLVEYHLSIMGQAGLIDTQTKTYKSGDVRITALGLTWEGQDFLAAIEDDTVWHRAKETIANAVGSTTLAVIKSTAEGVATAAIRNAGY